MSESDLVVLWYRPWAKGVSEWTPIIVPETAVEDERKKLEKRFEKRSGVETKVKRYRELP